MLVILSFQLVLPTVSFKVSQFSTVMAWTFLLGLGFLPFCWHCLLICITACTSHFQLHFMVQQFLRYDFHIWNILTDFQSCNQTTKDSGKLANRYTTQSSSVNGTSISDKALNNSEYVSVQRVLPLASRNVVSDEAQVCSPMHDFFMNWSLSFFQTSAGLLGLPLSNRANSTTQQSHLKVEK